jgi:hypothetical protein
MKQKSFEVLYENKDAFWKKVKAIGYLRSKECIVIQVKHKDHYKALHDKRAYDSLKGVRFCVRTYPAMGESMPTRIDDEIHYDWIIGSDLAENL